MVEEVEDLSSKLSIRSLSNVEVLRNGQIGIEEPRTVQRVAASESVLCRTRESVAGSAVRGERRYWSKELPERCSTSWCLQAAHVDVSTASMSCPARTCIDVGSALVVAHAEWQAAAPVNISGQLKTAKRVIGP